MILKCFHVKDALRIGFRCVTINSNDFISDKKYNFIELFNRQNLLKYFYVKKNWESMAQTAKKLNIYA